MILIYSIAVTVYIEIVVVPKIRVQLVNSCLNVSHPILPFSHPQKDPKCSIQSMVMPVKRACNEVVSTS